MFKKFKVFLFLALNAAQIQIIPQQFWTCSVGDPDPVLSASCSQIVTKHHEFLWLRKSDVFYDLGLCQALQTKLQQFFLCCWFFCQESSTEPDPWRAAGLLAPGLLGVKHETFRDGRWTKFSKHIRCLHSSTESDGPGHILFERLVSVGLWSLCWILMSLLGSDVSGGCSLLSLDVC